MPDEFLELWICWIEFFFPLDGFPGSQYNRKTSATAGRCKGNVLMCPARGKKCCRTLKKRRGKFYFWHIQLFSKLNGRIRKSFFALMVWKFVVPVTNSLMSISSKDRS